MRNTLETTETPGRGLDDLEGGTDRVRRGVGGAGDHPVGEPELDHHRAEVGRVGDRVRSLADRDRPCAHAAVRTPARSAARSTSSNGLSTSAAETSSPSAIARDRTSNGSPRIVRRATPRDSRCRGRAEDAVVVAFREDDVLVRGSSPLQQVVLEHQRRDHVERLTSSRWSRSTPSTLRSNSASAVSYLRCESAARRPRAFVMRTVVS